MGRTKKSAGKRTGKSAPALVSVTAAEAAKLIGIPLPNWPGNCSGIADAFLKAGLVAGDAKYRYGHYHGPVADSPANPFRGRLFSHHAWVEVATPDGPVVVDPTRWVFEATEPYIHVGPLTDDYDFGSNRLRDMTRQPPPPFKPTDTQIPLAGLEDGCKKVALALLRHEGETVSFGQAMWLANLSLAVLGNRAKPLYEWLIANEQVCLIPIDNRQEILW